MAGVIVDVLLQRLATLALDKIERELKLMEGVKQEIDSLTLKLEAIRAVLEDAEQRQVMEANVKLWLNHLNDVSYDMDDVLDEWITRVLKHQLEKQERYDALVTAKKKVCFPYPSSCFRFGQVNYQLFLRHEIAKKIEELNGRLALIDQNKQSFGFQNITRELPQRQKTTALPNVKTFGRDTEKNLIVSKLLSESSEGSEVPLIIPIVGMGGMGKTFLANEVYNDDRITSKSHFDNYNDDRIISESPFDKRIWVCVSDPFDEIKIGQAIIEGLDKNNTLKNSNELQALMQCIFELVEGKRFLVVLDDVWSPNLSQWDEVIKPLRNGALGSRVVVTTRNEEVVTLMKATTQMIPLKELGEPFCSSLFYYNANVDENNVSKEFSDIGLELVKRCNGLPLAAKTIGRLMQNKKKIHEWRDILNSKTWDLKEIQQDVFRPLLLSYHDLDPAIRRCLLYCVLFSKDHKYDKTTLIELWMSQDYLNPNESKGKMKVGQNYFDDLVRRSFFQDIEVDDKEGNKTCKIHDIVHDFLQYLTKNECLILGDGEVMEVPNEKVRHLAIAYETEIASVVPVLSKCKKLRTCYLKFWNWSVSSIGPMLESIKGVRTLFLYGYWNPHEIPETIGGLIHLRYLDLSESSIKELPRTMGSLYNLQTLRLVGCWKLERVYVGRLINLRHLHVERSYKLKLIEGIEKLTELQTLPEFHVGGLNDVNKLEHLKDLNQLQGSLTIEMEGMIRMPENIAAIIVNKARLLNLRLQFNIQSNVAEDREIMNCLEPHPDLESLSIYYYKGQGFSDWLSSLQNLKFLTIEGCDSFGGSPLGKLKSLESLRIERIHRYFWLGKQFLGIEEGQTSSSSSSIFISFPKLKKLSIGDMTYWYGWVGLEEENCENITIMPCLSQLSIWGSKHLKALPDFLWKTPLQKLHISSSPILQDLYRQGTGEQWAKICHIPSINIEVDSGDASADE